MNMYTLLCLKWITNKDLRYSTGNSVQCNVATWIEGVFGGEWIHAYVWLRLFAVYLKLITQIQNKKLKIYNGWGEKYFSGRPLSLSRKCPGCSIKVGCLNVKILQDQKFKGEKMKWHFRGLNETQAFGTKMEKKEEEAEQILNIL